MINFFYIIITSFFIELIIGGPGFWTIFGLSVRKLLFFISFLTLILLTLSRVINIKKNDYIYLCFLFLFLIAWAAIIPILREGNLAFSFAEGLPLLYLAFSILLINFYKKNPQAWSSQRLIFFYLIQSIALISILIWVLGTINPLLDAPIKFIVHNYFSLGASDKIPGIYVGLMDDGFFRVLWITHISFLPMLFISLYYQKNISALIFMIAIFATYTRAFWIVLFILLIFLFLRDIFFKRNFLGRRLIMSSLFLSIILLPIYAEFVIILIDRLIALLYDESSSVRITQSIALFNEWQKHPLIGNGFGSYADFNSSSSAPYSYELTYLGLLMKLGLVGFLTLFLLFAYHINYTKELSNKRMCNFFGILSILAVSFTNPYLINFVGLGFISMLIIEYNYDEK